MTKHHDSQFPHDFLWGAAISAHQVDGGTLNQWSIWEQKTACSVAKSAKQKYGMLASWPHIEKVASQSDSYISGRAANHHELYRHDFDLLQNLHMNALRFSIEWSRVEPNMGEWDDSAIEYYRNYLHELKQRGITPIVTLFHFTLPVWFAEIGGFEKRRNLKYFTRFAEKVIDSLGDLFEYVVTVNEPESFVVAGYVWGVWPPGERRQTVKAFRVYHHLATAHRLVARLIHERQGNHLVSASRFCVYAYAGDRALLSRVVAKAMHWFANDLWFSMTKRDYDWLGINYYYSARMYGFRVRDITEHVNDMGVPMEPANIEPLLEQIYRRYKLPIIVTESGTADGNDQYRQWWLEETLAAMERALQKGVDLRGYIHWTLMDNFE